MRWEVGRVGTRVELVVAGAHRFGESAAEPPIRVVAAFDDPVGALECATEFFQEALMACTVQTRRNVAASK